MELLSKYPQVCKPPLLFQSNVRFEIYTRFTNTKMHNKYLRYRSASSAFNRWGTQIFFFGNELALGLVWCKSICVLGGVSWRVFGGNPPSQKYLWNTLHLLNTLYGTLMCAMVDLTMLWGAVFPCEHDIMDACADPYVKPCMFPCEHGVGRKATA
jgi:hypothetical protein